MEIAQKKIIKVPVFVKKTGTFFFRPMKVINKCICLSVFLMVLNVSLKSQTGSFISLKQQIDVTENGKKINNEVDLYFDNNKKILTKYYHFQKNFILISNSLGEIKTYYPSNNEVVYNQARELS